MLVGSISKNAQKAKGRPVAALPKSKSKDGLSDAAEDKVKAQTSDAILTASALQSTRLVAKPALPAQKGQAAEDDDLWDEDDMSFEQHLSQMRLPEVSSSQSKAKTLLYKAVESLPETAAWAAQEQKEAEAVWGGFKRRDRRGQAKAAQLSTKSWPEAPVAPAVQPEPAEAQHQPLASQSSKKPGLSSRPVGTTVAERERQTRPAGLSKETPKGAFAPRNASVHPLGSKAAAKSVEQPTKAAAISQSRSGTLTRAAPTSTSSEKLVRAFKCPGIKDAGKANAQREVWKSTSKGVPPVTAKPLEDEDLAAALDVDCWNDANMSF